MGDEQTGETSTAALLEEILDRSWREDGVSQDELQQGKIIAQIESRLVAGGRSIKDIYSEWERSTPAGIIAKYIDLIGKDESDERVQSAPQAIIPLTGHLHMAFTGYKEHPLTGAFWIISPINLPVKVLAFRCLPSLRPKLQQLKREQSIYLQIELHQSDEVPEIFVNAIDIPDRDEGKFPSPTFPPSQPRPYLQHYPKANL